jgi:hypothetical protein
VVTAIEVILKVQFPELSRKVMNILQRNSHYEVCNPKNLSNITDQTSDGRTAVCVSYGLFPFSTEAKVPILNQRLPFK